MYKSPIEIVYGEVKTHTESEIDKYVYECIQEVGVNVNKEELIRALKYDRDQYEKGYYDAKHEYAGVIIDNEGYERCTKCNEHETGMRYFTFCPRCGARLKE